MPVVLAVLAALGGAYFWYWRLKNAKEASETLIDVANDVRLAARRFGFRRKVNVHPVESIDDDRLGVASLIAALMQVDRSWDRDMGQELSDALHRYYAIPGEEADEMVTFARWMSEQCGTKHEAVRRIAKRLADVSGKSALEDIKALSDSLVADGAGNYSEDTSEAIETLRRQFRYAKG